MVNQPAAPVILVAEDEPLVLKFIETALGRAGYKVLSATNGVEALRISRSHTGEIDLLLTDIKMPYMVGPELASSIVSERPGIRVMIMTGQSSGQVPDLCRLELLRKPFIASQLLERVERTLGSPPTPLL
ncbi:MAG: response regulator [Bryobacteraceae bacterium]